MKKVIFLYVIINLIFILRCHAQNMKMKGDILFYYTIVLQSVERPCEAVVTLDSVRIHSDEGLSLFLLNHFKERSFTKIQQDIL